MFSKSDDIPRHENPEFFSIFKSKDKKEIDETCRKLFNLSSQNFYNLICQNIDQKKFKTIVRVNEQDENYHIRITIHSRMGKKIAEADLEVPKKGNRAHIDGMDTFDRSASKYLGRQLSFNAINLFKTLGRERISLLASSTVGAYFWAKMGFLAPEESHTSLEERNRNISNNLKGKFNAVSGFLPEHVKIATTALLNDISNPYFVWAIADMGYDIKKSLTKSEWAKYARDRRPKDIIKRVMTQGLKSPQPFKLGRYFLLNESWYGVFDFSNQKQVQRLEKYTGNRFSRSNQFKPSELSN